MVFLDTIKNLSLNHWYLIIITFLWASLSWMLHFILEFSVLISLGYQDKLYLIIFHFTFLIFGALTGLLLHQKAKHFVLLAYSISALTIALIGLVFSPNIFLACFFLSIAGFMIGLCFSLILYQIGFIRKFIEDSGKLAAMNLVAMAPLLIISALIDNLSNSFLRNLIHSVFLAILGIVDLFFIYKSGHNHVSELLYPQKRRNIKRFIRNKENIPYLGLAFFWGLFFTNTYYGAIIILKTNEAERSFQSFFTNGSFASFLVPFFAGFFIFSIVSGFIADKIGRRITILFGLIFQALAYLLLPLINSLDYFIPIFALATSLGFTFALNTTLGLFLELPKEDLLIESIYFAVIGFGIGQIAGIILEQSFVLFVQRGNYEHISLILLFLIVSATLIIFQLKETKPSKEELEWKSAVQYLLVLSKSGVPLYSYNLSSDGTGARHDELLLGGALVAVSTLIKEIAQNREKLKVVKQEGFSILFEEGEEILTALLTLNELKILRRKMEDFTLKFENFFGEILKDWSGDTRVFLPTKQLVEELFT